MRDGALAGVACTAMACMAMACTSGPEPLGVATAGLDVSSELELDPPSQVGAPGSQYAPVVLATPGGYLAVWSDERDWFGVTPPGNPRAVMARIATDGTVVEPAGVPLTPPDPPYMQWSIYDGACATDGTCLLLVGDNVSVLGFRVQNGVVLDAAPLPLVTGGFSIQAMSVAWDGAQFRIVWRNAYDGIYTARVSLAGVASAPLLVVPDTFSDQAARPGVACGGAVCLVTYLRGGMSETAVNGRRVDPSGLIGSELGIFDPPSEQLPGKPVFDGTRFWVGASSGVSTIAIDVIRVELDGTVLAPIEVAGPTAPLPATPVLGATGDGIEVVWVRYGITTSAYDLFAARIDASGTLLDPGGIEIAPSLPTSPPGFACRTGQCLVAWSEPGYNQSAIVGDRLSGVTELDPAGFDVSTAPAGQTDAAIAFGGGQYLAVWRDSRLSSVDAKVEPIRGALVSPALAPLVPVELAPSLPGAMFPCTPQDSPAVGATTTGTYLVAWHAGCAQDDLYAQIVDATGAVPAPAFVVDATAHDQTQVAVASNGAAFVAVWTSEEASPPTTIYARRYAATGAPLDAARFLVAANGFEPAVAFDGSAYIVVWAYDGTAGGTGRDIHAARVGVDGVVLDPAGIVVANLTAREVGASVACGTGTCLIAWRSGASQVRAARIQSDGTILDPGGFVVGSAAGTVRVTTTTFDGDAFVVAWQDGAAISGAVVGIDGVIAPPGEIVLADAATAIDRPALASDGAGRSALIYDRFDSDPAYVVRRVRARLLGPPLPQPDAAVADAAVADAAVADAAVADAPLPDAAVPDGAVPDGAVPDADVPDAAAPPDAAIPDAATPPDAHVPPPDAGGSDGGGGCCRAGASSAPDANGLLWLGVGALVLRRRRPRPQALTLCCIISR